MPNLKTDRDLLREYTETGVENAFQTLVQRHVDLVFATAHRGLNDFGTAQEITQNVFIALARKAAWLRGETNLAGWLHKTTILEIRLWWRGQLRRQKREQAAIELGTVMKDNHSLLNALAGELDEALLELRQPERQALLLRYFEGHSHREIGELLGAREDAVRMRIDKALSRLTQFFRRRGYAVPAVATTATVLGITAKAAPAGLVAAATSSALASSGSGALTGLNLWLARFMGLDRMQTTLLCVALVAAPIGWEWNANRIPQKRSIALQSGIGDIRSQYEQSAAEIDKLRSEAARLDGLLADARRTQQQQEEAARKLNDLKRRVRSMLSGADYRWPDDFPYVRVSKATVKSLDLLHRPPMAFGPSGALTESARELFAITSQEQAPTEQALASYWQGVWDLMAITACETNVPGTQPGRVKKTVQVPALGDPLKALGQDTRQQLTDILGAEREQLLFAGWDEGGIQLYSPGNLWKISEEPQTVTVWVEPATTPTGATKYGASWSCVMGGMSSESSEDPSWLSIVPKAIAARFFNPWLEQFGITNSPN
jgi:RNA polymerase sigma factor (sigma-70 family)